MSPDYSTRAASLVAVARVRQIGPPEWSTPDRQRPANPHLHEYSIFTPLLVDVEEYLKGNGQGTLLAHSSGGAIGQDSVERIPDRLSGIQPGQQAMAFLMPAQPPMASSREGMPVWFLETIYLIRSDGIAQHVAGQLPYRQLREIVQRERR